MSAAAIPECMTCGACCDHPEPWSIVELTLGDLERVPPDMTVHSYGNRLKMARAGNRCVALSGSTRRSLPARWLWRV